MSSELLTSPPVLVTLFTGLLIAFAVQLLMTTFGVAAGITALGYLPGAQSETTEPEESPETSGTGSKIGFAIGAGTLLTVNAVLFTACFLAVKLSIVNSVALGAVLGVVIWSGYFLVLTWLSSKAAGSLLGVLVGAFNSGVQGLMATVTSALGRNKGRSRHQDEALGKRMAATESSVATLQDQLDANHRSLEDTLRDYVQTLQPPKPDLQSIRQEVATVLASAGLPSVAKAGLSRIDRHALVDLVSSRTDFSKRDVNEVVDQLEGVWQEVVEAPDTIADITSFFQSASPEMLTPETINARLQELLEAAQPSEAAATPTTQAIVSPLEPKQLLRQLMRTVRDRVDLSDLDVSSILQQLLSLTQSSASSADSDRPDPFQATIKADVEDYLLNAYPWNLTRKTVQAEFNDVLYDPEANPAAVRHQLLALDREFFVALLEQRDDLPSAKVHKIADRLQAVREDVLQTLAARITEAPAHAFMTQVDVYLQAAKKADLKPANFEAQLQTSLQDAEANVERWSDRLQALSRTKLAAMLNKRQDLSQEALNALTTELEATRDRLLADIHTRQTHAEAEAVALWQKLGDYVSDRSQKLTARTIQRQLKTLTKVPKADASLRPLPLFDRATAEQWLRDRQDLSEKQTQRLLSQLEKAWNNIREVPEAAEPTAQSNHNQVSTLLENYIQHLDPTTLSIANLSQGLLNAFKQPGAGIALLSQLTEIDWKPLLEQVQRRQDLTAEQQQQLQQHLQRSLYTIGKFPRRLALRSKRQVQNWQDLLLDYLRHAERDELSLDRLPFAVQHLLKHAQAASGTSIDWLDVLHLPTLSRDGLVTLLSERGDMTVADINQLVEQVETLLQQAIAQAKALQEQAQTAIATTFDRLRHYIAALPLPGLDYDRIKHDLQQVLVDPHLGLESLGSSLGETLRSQLSTLNRETLTTLISTRDDLSDVFAQQVTDRIDSVRLSALAQIETIQQSTQHRLETLKQQARQQAEDTRKAVAIAAWWLFVTALSSACTSAIAGALAVGGMAWVESIVGWLE